MPDRPEDDALRLVAADTAARVLGYLANAKRPANLADPTDVQLLYDNALTMLHCRIIDLIAAAKSLGIDTTAMSGLIARWAALTDKTLDPALVHHFDDIPAAPPTAPPAAPVGASATAAHVPDITTTSTDAQETP